jgi:predicted esterase
MTTVDLGFAHVFQRAKDPDAPVLLLLHGTGGDEHDLLPIAAMLAPDAAVLSPRGNVLENGMPRFFRRLAEGVFDLDDLRFRTHELARFVAAAANRYDFDRGRTIGVGFSNGANIAASLLLLEPDALAGAVLFRAMVPLVPDELPPLAGKRVLISSARHDPLIQPDESERLRALFERAGAEVAFAWQRGGHQLTSEDLALARQWLAAPAATSR